VLHNGTANNNSDRQISQYKITCVTNKHTNGSPLFLINSLKVITKLEFKRLITIKGQNSVPQHNTEYSNNNCVFSFKQEHEK